MAQISFRYSTSATNQLCNAIGVFIKAKLSPFNPVTKIRFDIKKSEFRSQNSEVTLKIYDALGREVETLVNEQLVPGTYEVTFDGTSLTSGLYFYKLTTDGFAETKRMLLIK